jgi:hypothetical protein
MAVAKRAEGDLIAIGILFVLVIAIAMTVGFGSLVKWLQDLWSKIFDSSIPDWLKPDFISRMLGKMAANMNIDSPVAKMLENWDHSLQAMMQQDGTTGGNEPTDVVVTGINSDDVSNYQDSLEEG